MAQTGDKKKSDLTALERVHGIIISSHIHRFESTYKRFFEQAQTQPLVDYFFRKIYNLEGKRERDALALKTFDRFKNLIKESTKERIQHLIDLNAITDQLDLQMSKYILNNQEIHDQCRNLKYIKEPLFSDIMQRSNKKIDRMRQLKLTIFNFESFFELSKQSRVEMLMKPARVVAKFMGAANLFEVFEEGYLVSKPVGTAEFKNFIEFVKINEVIYLNEVFKSKITTDLFNEPLSS